MSQANYELASLRRRKGYSGTGFPWEMTPEEVILILKRFPKTFDESIANKFDYCDVFLFEGSEEIYKKARLDINMLKDKSAKRACYHKWHYLQNYLIEHPALITPEMDEVIKSSEMLKASFIVRQADILPATADKPATLTISQDNTNTPLAKQELLTLEITEKLLDKASLALDYMTPQQIQKASIGTKAKMVENMIKSYTMFKGEGGGAQFTKINIKQMNVVQARELSRKAAQN